MFSGFLFGRRTLADKFCLYYITGYNEGLGRYNAIDLADGRSAGLIKSIDENSVASTIEFVLVPSESPAYFSFVNFLRSNSVVSISVE